LTEDFVKEKGASDFLAYYVHQPIENWIVRKLRYTWVTPNQVTVATNILAYIVTILYLSGNLLSGSILSFAVGIADGIDGKLARAKKMTSNLGKLEHAFDLLYEFSWIAALSYSVFILTGDPASLILGTISILLISFYRYCYDTFSRVFGTSFDTYTPFEKSFRRFAGRRNLYNITILVSIIFNVSLVGLYIVMGHALITAIVYAIRVGKHLHAYDLITKNNLPPRENQASI
jgi:CDP-L-myo-inositol myo-inositolphosphotransferase